MIKYLGSKRVLVPMIGALYTASGAETALDLFTGTTRVAQEFCRRGAYTTAVDVATYSEVLAQCYVELDANTTPQAEIDEALAHLSSLPPKSGYFTEVFCESSRYFHPKNGARIDAIREGIDQFYGDSWMRPVLLTSLLEAADAVDSTVGLQMAYLKKWAPRALRDLKLEAPTLTPGTGRAVRADAVTAAKTLPHVDFAYLDPPYNQHRYFTNYHVWETLIRWDKPDHYGIACKRVDAREDETKSPFNYVKTMPEALRTTIVDVNADLLVLSFSNEGFVPLPGLVEMCEERGDSVSVLAFDSKRHVGARIGIHNLAGKRVGKVSHTRNIEYLVISGRPDQVEEVAHIAELGHHLHETYF